MARITVKDVDGMFMRASAGARRVGIDTAGWSLSRGSKTNGISWKLDGDTIALGGWGHNYLGMTAGEAYDHLWALALAFDAVAQHSTLMPR